MAALASHPVDGQAFFEFELKLPGQSVPYIKQQIAPEICEICETVFGYSTFTLGFRVNTPQYLDRILKALDANGEPFIRWRAGLGNGETVSWLPWQLYIVIQASSLFEGIGDSSGHYIKLTAYDRLRAIDRSSNTKAHRGTISSIVSRLAANNQLIDAVIEDTAGDGLWIQSYEGDFEFVRERLLPRARSTRGRGNYYLYTRDNTLHFHTIDYQTTLKDFAFYSSPSTTLEAIDVAQTKIDAGSAGVATVYHDPYTGRSRQAVSDPNRAVRLGNSMPRLDKIPGAKLYLREHATLSRDDNAGSSALAQNAYESARSECFQLKMQTSKTAFLRPGDLLRIALNPNNATTSSWGGIYLVATASHIIDHGELSSVYILQRGEQQVARNSHNELSAYGVDNLTDEQNAPGYDLNVREAQSSMLTKGAGKVTGSGVVLKVQDRNKV